MCVYINIYIYTYIYIYIYVNLSRYILSKIVTVLLSRSDRIDILYQLLKMFWIPWIIWSLLSPELTVFLFCGHCPHYSKMIFELTVAIKRLVQLSPAVWCGHAELTAPGDTLQHKYLHKKSFSRYPNNIEYRWRGIHTTTVLPVVR